MTRRIEHRSLADRPAAQVHAALVNREYLLARLEVLGGTRTELLEHSNTEEGVRTRLRQGVPANQLPSLVRNLVAGDLMIDRSETWREVHPGQYDGEVAAAIPGVPGSITGSQWLRDTETGPGSELILHGEVQINLPLVSSKLESLVTESVQQLLAAEDRFTRDWLAEHDTL